MLPQLKVLVRRCSVRIGRLFMAGLSRPYVISRSPCVILAPHQDDETLGCGGLIARKRHEGQELHVIFLTDGGASHRGHASISGCDLISLRRLEALRAMEKLSVDSACVQFWNEPDGTLDSLSHQRKEALINRLAALLASVQPGRLFVPCSPDGSSEHDPIIGFAQQAAARAGNAPEIWQYPIWSWWNPLLLASKIFRHREIYRLPAEDYHGLKQKALRCYGSQLNATPPAITPPLPRELVDFCLKDPEYFFLTKRSCLETKRA